MSDPAPRADARPLGLLMAIALVVGNIVGSGIFMLPATLAPYGGASLVGWGLTTLGALLLALTFGWLGRVQPGPGGMFAYTRTAFGDFAAFLVGWSYWVSIWVTTAAIAVAMVGYLAALVPALAASRPLAAATALLALWSLTLVNARGVHGAGLVQVALTVLKLAPLLLLVGWGVFAIEPDHLVLPPRGEQSAWQAVTASATIALWAMLGLESASIATARIRDPEKNVARATLLGTSLAAAITVAACTIVMGLVPPAELASSSAPFAAAARTLWGEVGAAVIAATGALSCFGALNGWILLQGQLPQAMAKGGLFPARAARNGARGTPVFALVLGSALASLLIAANYEQRLVRMFAFFSLLATVATLVGYLACTLAGFVLLRGSEAVRLTPARATVLALGFVYSVWALIGAGTDELFWGFVLLLSGLPVFVLLRQSRTAISS